MAITQEQLLVSVEVQTRNAAQSLQGLNDKFESLRDELKATNTSVKGTEKALTGFGATAVKMNQALELAAKGVRFLIAPIKEGVQDFIKAQTSIDKMRKSVQAFGQGDIPASIKRFEELREQIEESTLAEADMVDTMVSAAQALGLTDDMTEKLVRTAGDLAAVNGGDVQESYKQLLGTLKGNGKALGEYSVLLQGLTEDQLKAGKGVDVLAERFSGMAEKAAKTLPGTLVQIQKVFADVFKEIGEILVKGFDLDAQAGEVFNFLKELKKSLESVKPAAIEAIQQMRQFGRAIMEGLGRVDWEGIAAGIAVIGVAIAAAFAPQIIASVSAFAASLAAAAVPAALLAAKIVLITAALAGIAAAVDIAIRNVDLLKDSFLIVFSKIKQEANELGLTIIRMLTNAVTAAAEAFPAIRDIATTAMKSLNAQFNSFAEGAIDASKESERLGASITEAVANLDTGFSGKIWDSARGFVEGFNSEMGKVPDTSKKASDSLTDFGNRAKLGLGGVKTMSDEAKKALEELAKKVADLQKTQAEAGASEADMIRIRAGEQARELAVLEEKLRASRGLTEEAKRQLEIGRNAVAQTIVLQLEELRKKNLEEIRQSTLQLAAEVSAMDATTRERIEMERKAALAVLDIKRKELEKEKELNAEALGALEAQAALVNVRAEKQTEKAPGQEFEKAAQVGGGIATSITSAFTTGALGAAAGMMTGVGAIADVAQGIIDFIPQMLSKLTNLVNSLTDLPNKILQGVQGLFGAVLKFVQDFIPNIIKMIGGLLEAAVSFIETLPDVLINMLDTLPDMIMGLIDRLPELAERLITALITAAPRLLVQAVNFLVKDAPRIVIGMMRVFYLELPKAMFKAVVGAFKQIGGMLSNLFKGKFPKIQMDTQQISKGMKAAANKLSGESEKLFKVLDLKDEAKAEDKAKALAAQIENGMEKALSLWRQFWDAVLKAWRALWSWIDEKILQPIMKALRAVFEFLREVWLFVYDKVIKPLLEGVREVWLFVYNKVIKPFLDALKEVWDAVYNGIIKPFLSVLKEVWDTVWSTIMKVFLDGLKFAWEALKTAWGVIKATIIDPFITALKSTWDALKTLWQLVKDTIIQPMLDGLKLSWEALKATWNFVKDGIITPFITLLKGTWDIMVQSLKAVWDTAMIFFNSAITSLKTVWDGVVAILKGLWDSLKTIWDTIMQVFQGKLDILDGLSKIWDTIWTNFTTTFKTIIDTAKSVFDNFTGALGKAWEAAKTAFDGIGKTFSGMGKSIWDGFKSALDTGKSALTDLGGKAWDSFKTALDKGAASLTGLGKKTWESFADSLKDGAAKVTDLGTKMWDKLKSGLGNLGTTVKDALDKINPANLAGKMFSFDYKGKGTVENALNIDVPFAKFAEGGMVPGKAATSGDSALNDRILAMLSPGEAVIPRSQMQDPLVREVVQAILAGKLIVPGYWGGSVSVGGVTVGVSNEGVTVEGPPPPKPPTINDAKKAAGAAGGALSTLYKDSGVADTLGQLDPKKAWDKVKQQLWANLMKMFQHGLNAGGLVGEDSVFARLTPGEFVMRREAVSAYGVDTMQAMNAGAAGAQPSSPAEVNINLTVHTTEPMDEIFIRNKLMPRIREEFRRASVDGQTLVYSSGVRTR